MIQISPIDDQQTVLCFMNTQIRGFDSQTPLPYHTMMDILQQQDCDLTLAEGLELYYESFSASRSPLRDTNSGNLLRNHDCTHVIFGLDTSIEQENTARYLGLIWLLLPLR